MQICTECGQPKPLDSFRPGRDATVCGKCRYSSLNWGMADERAYEVRQRDKQFDKDNAAYKRLRAEGLQPRGVDKSSVLEVMADHKVEVQLGRSLSERERQAFTRDAKAML